jgi:hypothetical protein
VAVLEDWAVFSTTGVMCLDSTSAEWQALILAARFAVHAGLSDVKFIGDCMDVAEGVAHVTKMRKPHQARMRDQYEAVAAGLGDVCIVHVPRHANLAGRLLEFGDEIEFRSGLHYQEGIETAQRIQFNPRTLQWSNAPRMDAPGTDESTKELVGPVRFELTTPRM